MMVIPRIAVDGVVGDVDDVIVGGRRRANFAMVEEVVRSILCLFTLCSIITSFWYISRYI